MQRIFHFWQPAPNEHEAGWIRGLSQRGYPVFVYAAGTTPCARSSLGLGGADYGDAQVSFPAVEQLPTLLAQRSSQSDYHFFTGIKEFPLNRRAATLLARTSAHLFYISESKDPRGLKGVLRFLRDLFADRKWPKRIDGVLAMGQLGCKWFRGLGFPADRVFEFGYAVANPATHPIDDPHSAQALNIRYVGQLIKRKRIDLLLEAFARLPNTSAYHLTITGIGALAEQLQAQTHALGISHSVTFEGAVTNQDLRHSLHDTDLVVLPSDWDGWGAVANEALLAGCRVGVSDRCGSASLCQSLADCFVFRHGNVGDLSRAIERQATLGKVHYQERTARMGLVTEMIGESAITDYLLAVVDWLETRQTPQPCPPWTAAGQGTGGEDSQHHAIGVAP